MDIEDPKVFIKERGIYEIKELKVVGKHRGLFYAEYEGMKAAKKGNWPRVVFWAKRWLKLRSDKKGGKND